MPPADGWYYCHLVREGLAESRRQKTQLTLSLITTEGAQQALLQCGLRQDKNGIEAWMRLVKHFELTAKPIATHKVGGRGTSTGGAPGTTVRQAADTAAETGSVRRRVVKRQPNQEVPGSATVK